MLFALDPHARAEDPLEEPLLVRAEPLTDLCRGADGAVVLEEADRAVALLAGPGEVALLGAQAREGAHAFGEGSGGAGEARSVALDLLFESVGEEGLEGARAEARFERLDQVESEVGVTLGEEGMALRCEPPGASGTTDASAGRGGLGGDEALVGEEGEVLADGHRGHREGRGEPWRGGGTPRLEEAQQSLARGRGVHVGHPPRLVPQLLFRKPQLAKKGSTSLRVVGKRSMLIAKAGACEIRRRMTMSGKSDEDRGGNGEAMWTEVGSPGDFPAGELRAVPCGAIKLVVGRTETGRVFALDNRCPHEGYPLATGTLRGEALTCCWHNWKFDVGSGRCTLGGEGVRAFPVREREGKVEVDLAEPDPSFAIPGYLESMREAILDHDLGRALRDGVRALQAGFGIEELIAEVAAIDAEYGEYGSTHVLPVATDALRALEVFEGLDGAVPLGTVLDLCMDANQRLPKRTTPMAVAYDGDDLGAEIQAAVEAEDLERAEGLYRGAIASGASLEDLEAILFLVISDHLLSFGHPLIYLVKAGELLRRVGEEHAGRILPALLFRAGVSTREDTLPYMRTLATRLEALRPEFRGLRDGVRGVPFDAVLLRDLVLDGSPDEAFDAVLAPLRAGADPAAIAEALVGAAAHRLWRFDLAVEYDSEVVEGWLHATHRFTFASAVRNALRTLEQPFALAFLFQAAAFVQTGKRMDRSEGLEFPAERELDVDGILAAILGRDVDAAVGGALGRLRRGGDLAPLRARLRELVHSDPLVRPIVVAHAVKTLEAGFEECEALQGHPDQGAPLAAALRFLASPVVERRVRETAERSVRWVAEGRMPRKLTQ